MAVDMFIKIEGIDGESKDDSHKGEIDVLSWSWGASNSGSAHRGGGTGTGKVDFQDVTLVKWVDLSSPLLMLHSANGKHIPEATLVVRKAGDKPLEYMTIKMTNILVTSYQTGGSGGEEALTESVSLNFEKCEYKYASQTEKGAKDKEKGLKWDIAANTGSAI